MYMTGSAESTSTPKQDGILHGINWQDMSEKYQMKAQDG